MTRRALLLSFSLALVAGCQSTGYYTQAVNGQFELLNAARPVDEWLADPATGAPLRERLETARRIRAFATRELGLPDNRSYTRYAQLDRRYVLWNVFAAPEFSVEARQECFFIAGCVAYQGFFAEADARTRAAALRDEGYDVFVAGVPAYSTLGWFDDPLVSTFIRYPDAELARLMFHELAHQVVYVQDDSAFNESFAAAVEEEGLRRWLAHEGRAAELPAVERVRTRRREFGLLIEQTRERLRELYREPLPAQARRERKRAEFERLRERYAALKTSWGSFAGYDRFFRDEPNNALLVAFSTYARWVPAFEQLLARANGDLPKFYRAVRELAYLPEAERSARLAAMTEGG
jgi:predicted aminopeptidase